MKDTEFKKQCDKIIGDVFSPGYPAAFVVMFDIGKNMDGMEIISYGPFNYNPFNFVEISAIIKSAKKF